MSIQDDSIVELNIESSDIIVLQLPLTSILADLLLALPKTLTFTIPGKTDFYCVFSYSSFLKKQKNYLAHILDSGYLRKMSSEKTVHNIESSLYHGACYISDYCVFPEIRIQHQDKVAQLPLFMLNDIIGKYKELTTIQEIKETTQVLSKDEQKLVEFILEKLMKSHQWDDLFAELYSLVAKDRFLYDEINDEWYLINKYNIWNNVGKEGYIIMNDMRLVMYPMVEAKYGWIEEKIKELNIKIAQSKNEVELIEMHKELEELKKKFKRYISLCKVLHTVTSKKHILTSLKGRQPATRLFEVFDTINLNLFAFNNGVYDLEKRIFRLPLPSELITTTCGYDYQDKDELNAMIEDINKIITSITLNEQDRSSLLMEIAQCLSGSGINESFYIWKGAGGNGKGVLRDLVAQSFGPYFDAMNIEYLTKSKNQSSATGADDIMAKKKNCRIVMTTEPDSDTELKVDKLKHISGGDPVQCRFLYGKSFNYIPKWKLFIQSNFEVKLQNTSGKSLIRRIRVAHFPFNFTDNPVLPNDRPADMMIKTRIKGKLYNIAFFHILLEAYTKWIDNGKNFNYSDTAKEHTQMLLMENDPITPFIDNYLIKTGNANDKIKQSELYEKFRKINCGETNTINAQEFKSGMDSKGYPPKMLDGYVIYRGLQFNIEKYNKVMEERKKAKNAEFDI